MSNIELQILDIFKTMSNFLWGWPLLLPLLITGILFTVSLKGIQVIGSFKALRLLCTKHKNTHSKNEGDISHFQALMTALSATVGTGNIAGVATAITIGGPGALFWMWLTGFFGMATKYAEAVLGVHYREKHENGQFSGGPMYYIKNGLSKKWQWLAIFFSISLAIAALGIGNIVQTNSMADVMETTFGIERWITGITVTIIAGFVVLGGIKRIAQVASKIVPIMIVIYIVTGTTIIVMNIDLIPAVFTLIFDNAFASISALAGGVIGEAVSKGVGRGVFSNESGMGSAPIVAAAAKTDHPVSQALVSMTQTFIDTIIVCSFTGIIIIMAGMGDGEMAGASLTASAFSVGLHHSVFMGFEIGELIISITLLFFVFSTIIGWYYYGEKGIEFILGSKSVKAYKVVFLICSFIGALMTLELAWTISEVFTAFMIIPNLIALILLWKKVRSLTKDYFKNHKTKDYKVTPFHNG